MCTWNRSKQPITRNNVTYRYGQIFENFIIYVTTYGLDIMQERERDTKERTFRRCYVAGIICRGIGV